MHPPTASARTFNPHAKLFERSDPRTPRNSIETAGAIEPCNPAMACCRLKRVKRERGERERKGERRRTGVGRMRDENRNEKT